MIILAPYWHFVKCILLCWLGLFSTRHRIWCYCVKVESAICHILFSSAQEIDIPFLRRNNIHELVLFVFLKWLNKMTLTKRKLPLPYQFRKEMSESNNRVILYLIKHVQGTRWKRELTTNSYRKGRKNTCILKNLRPQCL